MVSSFREEQSEMAGTGRLQHARVEGAMWDIPVTGAQVPTAHACVLLGRGLDHPDVHLDGTLGVL